jgi:trk system potassium uptake protein TrkH
LANRNLLSKQHPAVLVLLSFITAILLGSILLSLPGSTVSGTIPYLDALFTAASAVCVTGLIVVDTGSYFTVFGQIVILILIQTGGIGVMTISVAMFRWIRKSISYRHRKVMQDLFSHTPREDIYSLVGSVILFSLIIEAVGAILLTIHWSSYYPLREAAFIAMFHAVSAFCNAGFSLFADSMTAYQGSPLLNLTIGGLIVLGGLGFPVLYEIQSHLSSRAHRKKLSVQTRTVFLTTAILIITGALLFGMLEYLHPGGFGESGSKIIITSLFQSITARTAGFNTVDIASLKEVTIAILMLLMFIGASPGSCGGGVKTTTLAILAASSMSRIKGRRRVNLYRKSIPEETVMRALTLIVISISLIFLVFFITMATYDGTNPEIVNEQGLFLPFLFETVSAFGTVGLSMGITPYLNGWGKMMIILMMIIGRVGVLTFSYILTGASTINGIEYSEENIMIG